jgi:hypothetical protein
MRTLLRLLSLSMIIAGGLVACSAPDAAPVSDVEDPWGAVTVPAGEPLRIGVMLSQTGTGVTAR